MRALSAVRNGDIVGGLVRGIGWFRAGRSVPIHVHSEGPRRRVYWLTAPLVEIGVLRWGLHLFLGPDYGFLFIEIVLNRPRPVHVSFNTDGWRDW